MSLLTPRQRDVLTLARDGLSNRKIGQRLGITGHTVKWALANAMERLGVSCRTHAVVVAIRLREIPLDPCSAASVVEIGLRPEG